MLQLAVLIRTSITCFNKNVQYWPR